jgi:glycine cleavage system H protein
MKFSTDHVWISPKEVSDQSTWLLGITEHAQDALGDIVFVEMPTLNKEYMKGAVVAVVESIKAAADVFIPVSAQVLGINPKLKEQPGLMNSDPTGEGWLAELRLSEPAQLDSLMDATTYQGFCKTLS